MLKKIEALRKKPVEVRNRYAFWWAFAFTAFVVIIWVSSSSLDVDSFDEALDQDKIEGSFSRSMSDLKASVSQRLDTWSLDDEENGLETASTTSTSTPDATIDFATFFSTTSTSTPEVGTDIKPIIPLKDHVLIATSTTNTATITPQ